MNEYSVFCAIALTTSLWVAARRSARHALRRDTFSSAQAGRLDEARLGHTERVDQEFIRRTNSSVGTPQVRTSALVAALSDDIKRRVDQIGNRAP